jgi:hypothetical protein
MARITKVFASGTIGPVISYEYRGKPCLRIKPIRVRQTKATKASAQLFGQAARLSRLLREGLNAVLPDPGEKDMMYRLNAGLFRWLQEGMPEPELTTSDPQAMDAFEFNPLSKLSVRLKVKPTVEWTKGTCILHIPKLITSVVISAPAHTKTVQWHICLAGCSITGSVETWNAKAHIDMPYSNKEVAAQQIELPCRIPLKSITVVVVGLTYVVEKKGRSGKLADKKWLPCGVVGLKVKG